MGLIKCIDCGAMVSDRAKACPHCGGPIENNAFTRQTTSPNAPKGEESIKCVRCLRNINPGLKFCNYCGTKQPSYDAAPQQNKAKDAPALSEEEVMKRIAEAEMKNSTPAPKSAGRPTPPSPKTPSKPQTIGTTAANPPKAVASKAAIPATNKNIPPYHPKERIAATNKTNERANNLINSPTHQQNRRIPILFIIASILVVTAIITFQIKSCNSEKKLETTEQIDESNKKLEEPKAESNSEAKKDETSAINPTRHESQESHSHSHSSHKDKKKDKNKDEKYNYPKSVTTPAARPATPTAKPATPATKPATPAAKPATPVQRQNKDRN